MDFLKLLEEYENYKRGFGIEPKSSGHSACVDFAIWLNNNAAQQSEHTDPPLALVCDCESCKRVNFNLKSFAKSAEGSANR